MEIFQTLGSQGTILVGFVSTAAEIVVAFLFLRSFKIIGRCEYARLKANAADHLRCHAEWEQISLNNWLKKIRIASRDLGNNNRVEPEIDVRWRSSIVTVSRTISVLGFGEMGQVKRSNLRLLARVVLLGQNPVTIK